MRYVLYRRSDGQIIGHGTAQSDDLSAIEDDTMAALFVDTLPEQDSKVVDGVIVPLSEIEKEDLNFPSRQSQAQAEVESHVAQFRKSVATSLPFQDQAYINKRAEAAAYLADTSQPVSDFPMLQQISALRAMSAADLADLWLTTNTAWAPILNNSEIYREKAKLAVGAATTIADVEAALVQLRADLMSIPVP